MRREQTSASQRGTDLRARALLPTAVPLTVLRPRAAASPARLHRSSSAPTRSQKDLSDQAPVVHPE